jgi:hypothetical protein
MANKVKIARSGGASGHTAVTAPTGTNLEYGELGWLNGTNRLFIGRATADPTSDDGSPAPYEVTRTATAIKTGMAGFVATDFDISAFVPADGTGGIVSIKDNAVTNALLTNDGITIGATDCSLGGTTTAFTGLTSLDVTVADVIWAGSLGENTLTLGGATSTVAIAGDLTVAGTTTTISSSNLEITDKKIELGKGSANQAALDGTGIYCDPTTGTDVSFLVSTSGTRWTSSHPIISDIVGDVTGLASSATTSAALTGAQASAITANTAKTGITSGQASAITANTAKTGITSGQASAITANTAKTGISSGQASAITANTAKVGTEGLATGRMLGNFDPGAGAVAVEKADVLTWLAVASGATVGATTAEGNAITANTAKTGISSAQATAITNNTAKTGITSAQATAITNNTAKTGITSAQATAITNNTAKTSDINHNVTSNLGVTSSGSAYTTTCSDGTNASHTLATTSAWGVMSDEMFDTLAAAVQPGDVIDGGTPTWS